MADEEGVTITLGVSDLEENDLGEYGPTSGEESESDNEFSDDKHGADGSATLTAESDISDRDDDTSRSPIASSSGTGR